MKNFIVISISLFFDMISLLKAQNNADYLLATKKNKNPDGTQHWKYTYEDNGNSISLVQYYQNEKLIYTENNFKKNPGNKIVAFARTYANGKTPTEIHHFEYYPDGNLWKHYFTKQKDGKTLTAGAEIKWYADKAEEFRGNPVTGEYYHKNVYMIDKNKNIKQRQNFYLMNGKQEAAGSPTVYSEYDNKVNPDKLRKNYINENVMSLSNPLSEFSEAWSFGTVKTTYQYNENRLAESSKTLYPNGSYNIEHTTSYTYHTIVPKNNMDKIFAVAKSVNANFIQKMTYDEIDVYSISNTFYYIDGKVAFKVVPGDKRTFEPPIDKDKLKIALGKWVKDKNGNYTALK